MILKEAVTMSAKRTIQIVLVIAVLLTVFVFPRPAAAGSWCGNTYVVQPGDWLSKIARRCGVSLSAMYSANPWVGYYIYPGQVLTIPGGYAPAPGYYPQDCGPKFSDYYGRYYVVCRGDTLLGIAIYYGERLSYIQWHNHISNANRIYAGQFIYP
jgi:g-D-glutamyl-meso-diaminopimelate peptidase